MSPKYVVEVIVHGRVNVIVEAEDGEGAEEAAYNSPDVPELDKYYEFSANVVGEL